MTVTAAGSATTVDAGADLVLTATPNTALNPQYYAIQWSTDDTEETYSELAPLEGSTSTITGVLADASAVTITAEIMSVTYVNGVRTLVSLETPIDDEIEITVVSGD